MPLQNQPLSLYKLSLHKMGNYVTDTLMRLLTALHLYTTSHFTHIDNLTERSKLSICNTFHHIIPDSIPYSIANELTLEFLMQMDNRYEDIKKWIDQPWCKEFLQEFVQAMLNNSTTELKIAWHWKYVADILPIGLWDLNNLKELKISRKTLLYFEKSNSKMYNTIRSVHKAQCILNLFKPLLTRDFTNLEVLKLRDQCSDEILVIVSKSCRNLKCLDIVGSKNVTDRGIDPILVLQSLEKLNIRDTSIATKGREKLLTGLVAQRKDFINTFGCNGISDTVLDLLKKFPNLTCLYTDSKISNNKSHNNILQNIEVLKMDYRKQGYFPYPVGSIKFFGQHLVKLEFESIEVDVSHLSKSCPVLRTLKMRVRHILKKFDPSVSEFPSLQKLTLMKTSPNSSNSLFAMCRNLTYLELCTSAFDYDYENNFSNILTVNPLNKLETICLGSFHGDVPVELVRNIMLNCVKLKSIKVFGGNYTELRTHYRQVCGVEICQSLCRQVPNERIRTERMFDLEGRTGTVLRMAIGLYEQD